MSTTTKWRISDILEALAKERDTYDVYRVVGWLRNENALGRPRGEIPVHDVIKEYWFVSLPALFGLPEVRDEAGVEAVAKALVDAAVRLKVPKRVP